jgi:hypothetical protein
MLRTTWPLLVLLGTVVPAGPGWGQEPTPATLAAPRPAPYVLPPADADPPLKPIVNPILDDSPVGPPGFFAEADLFLLRPHLNAHLSGSPNQGADTVALSTGASLGTVVSPTFELGYRLDEQRGEFRLAYRFEDADRTVTPTGPPGGTAERDRLALNKIDFDWANRNPFSLDPGWDLRFNIGVRLATFYFDTQRHFETGDVLDARAASFLIAVGPEAGVEVSRQVFLPGLAVCGRVSGADVFGEIHQTFSEHTAAGLVSDSVRNQEASPTLAVEVGLSYSPPDWNYSRFQAGYLWEEFWQIGRLGDSNGHLLNRGLFLRAEINF